MLVPDEIRKSVVFVCYKTEHGLPLAGTAFFVIIQPDEDINLAFVYLVTAKHVVVNAERNSMDGKIWIRINDRKGGYKTLGIPRKSWKDHPSDTSVDVSVMAWVPEIETYDYRAIPESMIAAEEIIVNHNVGLGDEIFLSGLFVNHYGKNRNLPIIRTGNISLMPEERIATRDFGSIEAYLVEARSIGGLSGSPVFVNVVGMRDGRLVMGSPKFYLLGLMHGHWNFPVDKSNDNAVIDSPEKEAVNMGIAIVIPSTKIMEVINQSHFLDHRVEEVKKRRESKPPEQAA